MNIGISNCIILVSTA